MRRLFTTYHNIGVYYPDNDKLLRYNKNIIMATQKYIYDTKRFFGKNLTNSLPPVPPAVSFAVPPVPSPLILHNTF